MYMKNKMKNKYIDEMADTHNHLFLTKEHKI